jgi:hypothetical protein
MSMIGAKRSIGVIVPENSPARVARALATPLPLEMTSGAAVDAVHELYELTNGEHTGADVDVQEVVARLRALAARMPSLAPARGFRDHETGCALVWALSLLIRNACAETWSPRDVELCERLFVHLTRCVSWRRAARSRAANTVVAARAEQCARALYDTLVGEMDDEYAARFADVITQTYIVNTTSYLLACEEHDGAFCDGADGPWGGGEAELATGARPMRYRYLCGVLTGQ